MAFLLSFFRISQPDLLLPWLGFLRPQLVLGGLAIAVCLATRHLSRQLRGLVHPIFAAILLFVAAQVASVYYSGVRAMVEQLSDWYNCPVFVLLAVILVRDVDDLYSTVWGAILGSEMVILCGLYNVWEGIQEGQVVAAGAYGMYENHNDYTYVIILALPFLYTLRRVESRRLVRFLLLGMLVSAIAGVLFSLSRWGMLALVLEGALLILLSSRSGWRAALGLVFLGLIGTALTEHLWQVRAETQGATYTADDARESRIELWKSATNMFLDHPVLGVGSGRFYEYSREYYDLSHDQWGKNSHNTYLEILAGSGLAGFLPFAAFLYFTLRELWASPGPSESPRFHAIRVGALVGLLSIIFRALTNAKTYEWSFYVLAAIALCSASLRRQGLVEDDDMDGIDDAEESPGLR
jgi:O-antigen ligase